MVTVNVVVLAGTVAADPVETDVCPEHDCTNVFLVR
jgi:hypothetical protein